MECVKYEEQLFLIWNMAFYRLSERWVISVYCPHNIQILWLFSMWFEKLKPCVNHLNIPMNNCYAFYQVNNCVWRLFSYGSQQYIYFDLTLFVTTCILCQSQWCSTIFMIDGKMHVLSNGEIYTTTCILDLPDFILQINILMPCITIIRVLRKYIQH
jgi:hypothetical protein